MFAPNVSPRTGDRGSGDRRERLLPLRKILLVDDSSTSLMMTRILVMHLPRVRVYTAIDGKEALEKAERHQPDVIIMDVEMPVMDGYESTLRLGENPETCNIPVIMLTIHTDIDSVNRGFDCGCVDYLAKPVSMGPLLDSLNRALKRKHTGKGRGLDSRAIA